MALIVITGYPFSGKTYRASQLVSALEERISSSQRERLPRKGLKVIHVASHHASIGQPPMTTSTNPRDAIYSSATLEKTARASEIAAIKRALSKDTIVVADGLNYIKGYRYQLWCEAKAAEVRCLTIHTAVPQEDCREWNYRRQKEWGWDSDIKQDNITTNGKIGDLSPQSHTGLYGDTVSPTENGTSTLNAYLNQIRPSEPPEQSLRSLYLNDRTSAEHRSQGAPGEHQPREHLATPEQPTSIFSVAEIPYPKEPPYSSPTLSALLMRYEPPSPFSRWDTPLFSILPTDPTPPLPDIWLAIFPPSSPSSMTRTITEKIIPHAATVAPKATTAETLQLIEQRTSAVLAAVTTWARDHGDEGGEFAVPVVSVAGEAPKETLTLHIPYGVNVNIATGQRLRRRFVQMQRGAIAHGQETVGLGLGEVEGGFVRWLEGEWGVGT